MSKEERDIIFVMTVIIRGNFEQFSEGEKAIRNTTYDLQKKGIHVQLSGQEVTNTVR